MLFQKIGSVPYGAKILEMRFLTIKILIIFGILNSFISEINAQKFDLEGYYVDSINLASYYYLKIDSNRTFVYQSSGFSHHFVFTNLQNDLLT